MAGELKKSFISTPYIKEFIVQAFSCDNCEHKKSEFLYSKEISEKATKINFHV